MSITRPGFSRGGSGAGECARGAPVFTGWWYGPAAGRSRGSGSGRPSGGLPCRGKPPDVRMAGELILDLLIVRIQPASPGVHSGSRRSVECRMTREVALGRSVEAFTQATAIRLIRSKLPQCPLQPPRQLQRPIMILQQVPEPMRTGGGSFFRALESPAGTTRPSRHRNAPTWWTKVQHQCDVTGIVEELSCVNTSCCDRNTPKLRWLWNQPTMRSSGNT